MRIALAIAISVATTYAVNASAQEMKRMTHAEIIQDVLQRTKPLAFPRGDRLPIRASRLEGLWTDDDAEVERVLRELDARGIAMNARWSPGNREKSLAEGLRLARLQKKLGLGIGINANACMHSFCNGEERTFHVAEDGTLFYDDSFSPRRKMGCPFALKHRYPEIREQFDHFLGAYKDAGLDIEFIYLDWEIDGPLEWNGAWASSKKCTRCRQSIPNIDDFAEFQRALRTLRCEMQREVCAETVKRYFPRALVGNYSVYPHNGYRYWYDYYEEFAEGAPFKADQRAKYREWFHEFSLTGYTFAMPVVYTWYPTFGWYDFANADYRWFYNMLLVATNACKSTPADIPIISWLHWHTTSPPREGEPTIPGLQQFSEEKYRELLWHMLLRGTDGLMMWCPAEETGKEMQLLQEVYAAALEYKEFLDNGEPVSFAVPSQPGPVVSGLRLGNRVLVRRTDFDDTKGSISLDVDGRTLRVPRVEGECQVLSL